MTRKASDGSEAAERRGQGSRRGSDNRPIPAFCMGRGEEPAWHAAPVGNLVGVDGTATGEV